MGTSEENGKNEKIKKIEKIKEQPKMKIDILSLFPESFSPLQTSIMGRAVASGILEINTIDIRQFSKDKHKKCDDAPFGGGAGMLMCVQPLYDAISSVYHEGAVVVFPSPSGEKFSSKVAQNLSTCSHLIFVCGHYEGVDERIFSLFPIRQISLGDYVLTGGELPAMVMIDAISRFVDGVISAESLVDESFSRGLLEYPQFTRPQEFLGLSVPEVLVSGDHEAVNAWRQQMAIEKTKKLRPDLLSGDLSGDEN